MAEAVSEAAGAGSDPYAAALAENPYTVLPLVAPDDGAAALVKALQRMQRERKRTDSQDAALRALRDLPSRLAWDLLTLGTTPSVPVEQWQRTREELHAGRRTEARVPWAEALGHDADSTAALHVLAVLAANEVCWEARARGQATEEGLRAFVGRWAALLARRPWLEEFAASRCALWKRAVPTPGQMTQMVSQVGDILRSILQRGAGAEEPRRSVWGQSWDQERAALDAVAVACGAGGRPPEGWRPGFGPLGLADLGADGPARAWVAGEAARCTWPLPLSALRGRRAGFGRPRPERVAAAAGALQCLFGDLGSAAAEVWNGRGSSALARLRELTVGGRPGTPGAWFGSGEAARRARERAARWVEADALLLLLREGLSRPEVTADEICDTVARLLSFPRAVGVRLEALLSGRLRACAGAASLPPESEVERLAAVVLEVRTLLLGHDLGKQCGHDLAQLLRRHAAAVWERHHGRLAGADLQNRVLRNLFRAVDLAPHLPECVADLVSVLVKVPPAALSRAEREDLLRRGRQCLQRCRRLGGAAPELDQSELLILEQLDPGAARAELERQLAEARRAAAEEGGQSWRAAGMPSLNETRQP